MKPTDAAPQTRFETRMTELMGKDPQIAALAPSKEVYDALTNPELTLDRMIDLAMTGYADRPALGHRDYEIVHETTGGEHTRRYLNAYKTTSYGELLTRIKALTNAWHTNPEHRVSRDDMVFILGFASTDFAVIDFACNFAHATTVPMQSATSGADIDEMLANIEPVTVAATIDDLEVAAQHAVTHGRVRSLVAFDYDERDDRERAKFEAAAAILREGGVPTRLISLQALEATGRPEAFEFLPPHKDGDQRLAAIIHSSGSTGKPKGAMLSEAALKFSWLGPDTQYPVIRVIFAPFNHLLGRNSMISTLRQGGTAYFTLAPDMSTLFDDIRLARPTQMTFFPRVFELIYQHYQNEVAKGMRNGEGDEQAVGDRVRNEMSSHYLGDRLLAGAVGGAPTSAPVMEFIKQCFDIRLVNGYANTEAGAGAITLDNIVQRPPVIDYKLRDVPELGYYTTDKPYPRGELCYKSTVGISGYYKYPEATEALYDEDGYSITGDIVEERAPDHLVVIDRRKDVLKLSQGEYVAVGILGTKFEAGSPVIKQIYVYGHSLRAYLLAVVVPDHEAAEATLGDNYSDAELKSLIRDELQVVAKEQELKSFEVPRDFIIEPEPFSQENGLLSSVRKRLRPALQKKYGERLEAMYDEQEKNQEQEMRALRDPNSPLSVIEKIGRLLEVNLSIEGIDTSVPKTFAELGGDSLGAVMFSLSIEEVFGVSLPADTILSPVGSAQKWARLIEAALSGESDRPTVESVHGKDITEISNQQLQLESFIDAETLNTADTIPAPVIEPNTVLLTGANGFLGHIVCLEWLEKLAPNGGKVICLIRGADNAAAKDRLDQAFAGLDADLEARYQELAKDHLEVLAGDAGDYQLGLSDEDFSRLATEVDRISHVAALVNHLYSYQNLFGPNVVGTAEIIRLALTTRKKAIDFVSTEAVLPLLDPKNGINEEAPLLDKIPLRDSYAAGYGASKWAGEHLLLESNRRFGIPVNTFRGDMMLSDQRFAGQMNTADIFTRLLFSVIRTGLAPYSFYELNDDGSRKRGHYDGTPVDVVAAAVAGVIITDQAEYRTFNIHNYHDDDGCSLDAFVDWIESAGYPVSRMDDHSAWWHRFQDKLASLPDEEKQKSALDILGAFAKPSPVRHDHVGCDNFKALMKTLAIGPDVPQLSEDYIHKCLRDLVVLGYIDAPEKNQ